MPIIRMPLYVMILLFSLMTASCGGGGGSDGDSGDTGNGGTDSGSTDGGDTGGGGGGTSLPTGQWLERSVDVGGTTRTYFVGLPDGYDTSRSYPVVFHFHGCSPTHETNNVPVQAHSGTDAIHVRGRGSMGDCWDEDESGAGVALFDAMVPLVENEFSIDPTRQFVSGYSSGAFVAHALACVRPAMVRAVATVAGGYWGNHTACTESVAALMVHDQNDSSVPIGMGEAIRNNYLARNNCDAGAATTPTAHTPCESYSGCDAGFPVVWCQTSGMDHDRQDSLAASAFWDFFADL